MVGSVRSCAGSFKGIARGIDGVVCRGGIPGQWRTGAAGITESLFASVCRHGWRIKQRPDEDALPVEM